VLTWQQKEISI